MISCSVMGLIPTWSSEFSVSFLVLDFAFFHKIFSIVGPPSHCISVDHIGITQNNQCPLEPCTSSLYYVHC